MAMSTQAAATGFIPRVPRRPGLATLALLAGLLVGLASPVAAENWPGWRGPRGDGTSTETDVPVHWSAAEGIRWKVPLAGTGHASPIVWGDRVFVAACDPDTQERLLLCHSAVDGRLLWKREVLSAPLEIKHQLNSYASSTPATDGELVYVTFWETGEKKVPARNIGSAARDASFGAMVVAAYDFAGNQRWLVRPGDFTSCHGFCSCPVIHGDTVIVNGDHDGDGFIVALDRRTGREVWRIARDHNTRSYVTPIIRRFAGREQMILSGSRHVASYDPATGRELWRIAGPTEQFVASMVDNGRYVFLTAGFPDKCIVAIDPTGTGDVTASHTVWRSNRNAAYVPAPILIGDHLLLTSDDGVASCYEATGGERLWNARAGGHFSGSPVAAGGLAYFTDDEGVTTVVRPGPTFDVVSKNELGERCFSSPAVSGGRIYFRTEKHLVCAGPAAGK
jgi:outer membrane protein assembly factor BamB